MKRIFLDATCWVAAAGSETGGSSAIISLAQKVLLNIVVSQSVLREAEKNIQAKMGQKALQRFYFLLAMTDMEMCEPTLLEEEERWAHLTVNKDRHVLAAAFKSDVDVLVTLDRKHILTETVLASFPILIQDTKAFLTDFRG